MAQVNKTVLEAIQGTDGTKNPRGGKPKGTPKGDRKEGTKHHHNTRTKVIEAKLREQR